MIVEVLKFFNLITFIFKKMSKSVSNMNLFDDDDDDDVLEDLEPEEFDLKLEEKLGRSERTTSKLIELQSKFAHDPRFKISENFLNDDDKDGEYSYQ